MLNFGIPRTRIAIPRVKPTAEERKPLGGVGSKELMEKAAKANANVRNTQKLRFPSSAWMGRAWSVVDPYRTFDNVMQISIVAGVALGGLLQSVVAMNLQSLME